MRAQWAIDKRTTRRPSAVDGAGGLSYGLYVMPSRLNARIDAELAAKLRALEASTGKSTSDVVREAVELYHRQVVETAQGADAFTRVGFVGIAAGRESLSSDVKGELTRILDEKT